MAKKVTYKINMKDGSVREITGTEIIPNYAYDKREIGTSETINNKGEKRVVKTTTYVLTHIPTGVLITSADRVNSLKLLCMEPEFFEEFDPAKMIKAVGRFWNKYDWQEPKVA